MTPPRLIGVDWGSSRLRAYAVAEDARVLSTVRADTGVLLGRPRDLAAALSELLAGWNAQWPDVPIVASGMVGSRSGLREVGYVETPAGVHEVGMAIEVADVDGLRVGIVPGLMHAGANGVDVMRGEETVLFGLAQRRALDGKVAILPGTHSKWARMDAGTVLDFCTFATGELFDTLLNSGSLRNLADDDAPHDAEAFTDGVQRGLDSRGLLHDFFAVRAQVVAGSAPAAGVPSRLSGMLIGYELAESLARSLIVPGDPVVVVGAGTLQRRYLTALELAGMQATAVSAVECLAAGWLALDGARNS